MFTVYKDKALIVLAMLMAITLISWLTLYSGMLEPKILGVFLLFFAFVKVQLIISQFMELHKAVAAVRIAFWMWTITVAAIVIGMYLN